MVTANLSIFPLTHRSSITCSFRFFSWAIDAVVHCFNRLHHFCEHRFLGKEDHLAGTALEGFRSDIQAFID